MASIDHIAGSREVIHKPLMNLDMDVSRANDGKLNDKFPEGVTLHGELLASEGHKLITNKSGKARFLEEIDEFSFE